MKKRFDFQIHLIALLGACMMIADSCTKETVPELTTTPVTYLSEQSVTCTGNVENDGGAAVIEWGHLLEHGTQSHHSQ